MTDFLQSVHVVLLQRESLLLHCNVLVTLNYLLPHDGKMECENDRRFCAASPVLRAFYWTVVVMRELSQKAKLSIYQLIYVQTLTDGHELFFLASNNQLKPN